MENGNSPNDLSILFLISTKSVHSPILVIVQELLGFPQL